MHFVFTKRKVFNFAVSILNLVPPTRIELVMTGYQPIVIPFNYRGISGGKGEIRTHTGHRMKVLHNHYATLPYVNTLGSPYNLVPVNSGCTWIKSSGSPWLFVSVNSD